MELAKRKMIDNPAAAVRCANEGPDSPPRVAQTSRSRPVRREFTTAWAEVSNMSTTYQFIARHGAGVFSQSDNSESPLMLVSATPPPLSCKITASTSSPHAHSASIPARARSHSASSSVLPLASLFPRR